MKNSFIFYRSFYEAIDLLPDDIQFQIYKAITKYSFKNETIELSGISQAIFTLIKPQLEANNKRYENGIKGGRPSTDKEIENQKETEVKPNNNQTETEIKPNGNQTLTKAEPNVNENENVNLNENKKEEEKEKEKEKKEKNINIQKEKTFKSEIKAETCEEKARMPEVQKIYKTENIQDMPQQVGLVVKSDQHKSISEYSHNFQTSPEYAKYYKNFNQKKQYAEFVFMKTREYDELLIKYGDNVVSQAIEKLNNWKLEKLEKRCLKDIRGDDCRKLKSWTLQAVIESWKKIDYKKYQEYMGQFDKQNSRELQLKILELVEAKELTIKSAREFSAEQINEMYELWLKHRKKKKPDEQIQIEADDYEEENIDEY